MWMGTRYYFYLILLNAFLNVLLFVPRILIEKRFEGALMAIICAVPIGVTLIYVFVTCIKQYPAKGLPEILEPVLPRKILNVILAVLAFAWYLAGALTLLAFTELTNRYIDPDVSRFVIMAVFLAVVCYMVRMPSSSVLYGLEVLFAINAPFIIFILFKAVFNNQVHWDAVIDITTYLFTMPSYELIATAAFIFSGYTNLVIFHRVFGEGFGPKYLWLITIAGAMTLFSSVLLPMGFHGTVAVDDYTIPWIATANAMRLEYFVVERVLYLFILVYVMIALISTTIHWHVSLELLKSITVLRNGQERMMFLPWVYIGGFVVVMLAAEMLLNMEQVYMLARFFMDARFLTEFVIVGLLIYATRRKKKA